MSSIMRWRNGLMGLSVMAITPVSHEVSEPHDLETGRAILFIPIQSTSRALPLGRLPRERFSPWVETRRSLTTGRRLRQFHWPSWHGRRVTRARVEHLEFQTETLRSQSFGRVV